MKPLFVLILGCLPLVAVTAYPLFESPEVPAAVADRDAASQTISERVTRTEDRAAASKPIVDSLATLDLFAAKPFVVSTTVAPDAWKKFLGAWMDWTRIADLMRASLAADRAASAGNQADLSKTVDQLDSLAKRFGGATPPGTGGMMKWAAQKAGDLRAGIVRRNTAEQLNVQVERARTAFREGHWPVCVSQCDQLLSASAADPDTVSKIRLLKRRAEFHRDLEQTRAAIRMAEAEKKKIAQMADFIAKYGADPQLDAAEKQAIDQFRDQTKTFESREQTSRLDREGSAAVDALEKNLPPAFSDRVRQAAKLIADYSSETVRKRLRALARGWLVEALPDKKLREPQGIFEAETTKGEIIRGYFRPVTDASGQTTGYQRYPTEEQMRNPKAAVGTFPKETFVGPPQISLPQRAAAQYRQARDQAIAAGGQKTAWSQLASLCRELDLSLVKYRAKPGAGADPLSFEAEARFAESAAADSALLEKIFTP